MIDGRRRQDKAGDAGAPAGAASAGTDSAPGAGSARRSLISKFVPHLALGRKLARHGVTADQVTVVGLLLAALTGAMIALGHLWTGVALVTVGGLMDTLDGAVAKVSGSSSRRGAFLDSVTDRVADAFMFGGLAWYLAAGSRPELALLPFGILATGNVISYERAKAESLGWEGKGGLMERAERLILLAVALAFNVVMVPLLWVLLALCVFTAVQRFTRIWRQATAERNGEPLASRAARAGSPAALSAWRPARVESRWRAWREARAAGGSRPVRVRATRPRRRAGEPLGMRLRSALATDRPGSRQARVGGGRPHSRLAQRRQEGAASALRRRLGNGR